MCISIVSSGTEDDIWPMPANGLHLVAMTVAAIGLMLFLILALKQHAFLALILSSMALGLAARMAPAQVLKSIQFGVW